MNLDIRGCLGSRHYQSRNFSRSIFFLFSLSLFFFFKKYINIYFEMLEPHVIHTETGLSRKQSWTLPSVHVMGIRWKGESQVTVKPMYSSHWHEQNFTTALL